MILQALKDYYDRMAKEGKIAPLGWERKEIPFLVDLDESGRFTHFSDTRESDGKKLRPHTYLVPSLGEAKGSGTKANLFWENGEYFFGIPMDSEKLDKQEKQYLAKVAERHEAFVKKIQSLANGSESKILNAVLAFLENLDLDEITQNAEWEKIQKVPALFLFAVNGIPVTDMTEIKDLVDSCEQKGRPSKKQNICLVTGGKDVMAVLETPIVGVRNANTTGAHLISVNNEVTKNGNGGATPAFASYMKEQGANSPIGQRASFAYTTALNTLLSKDSRQKIQVGDATAVFWSDRGTSLEDHFSSFFAESGKDAPNALTESVKALYDSVHTGALVSEGNDARFFVLGLSPNSARISVRFWHQGTVREMSERFLRYFEDLRICRRESEKDDLSLKRLLVATAPLRDAEKISPVLAGSLVRSILEDLPFPPILLSETLRRTRTDSSPGMLYPRAKLIKGYLNRYLRFYKKTNERSLTVCLDKENKNIGYLLGRLFAVLEKIQLEAIPGITTTIRDKYYSAASSTPSSVFGNLLRLHFHHLAKLEEPRRIFFEQLIGEIISSFKSFPAHLSLNDQGYFAIGYYHQNRDFYTSRKDKSSEN